MAKLSISLDLSAMTTDELTEMQRYIEGELRMRLGPNSEELAMIRSWARQKAESNTYSSGFVKAIKAFKNRTHCSLKEAVDTLRPYRTKVMEEYGITDEI